LKLKELTYLHCQAIRIDDISNNFYCYLKEHPGMPSIFIILDHNPEKLNFIKRMEMLVEKTKVMPIVITDIKEKDLKDKLTTITEGRIISV
jgi:glucosamine 6-phosphate synthetase-like amidotransferase/phosphosugar isomerase protein